MKPLIISVCFILLFVSCNQSSKELELKQKELELKEREIALKEKEDSTSKINNTTNLKHSEASDIKEKLKLPFIGTRYFSFTGGSGGGMRIIIKKDRTVLITDFYSRERDKDIPLNTFYKGEYKEVMNGFKIKDSKIMLEGKACEDVAGGLNCDGVSLSN